MSDHLEHSSSAVPSVDAALHTAANSNTLELTLAGSIERRKVAERLRQRIEAMPSAPRFHAENFTVEFVDDPARGVDFDRRHEALNISRAVVEAFLARTRDDLSELSAKISGTGGFLMNYEGMGERRIADRLTAVTQDQGGWIMAETKGAPIDRRTYQTKSTIIGADGHFYIPADREGIASAVPLPLEKQDVVLEGEEIIAQIVRDPACALLIADICSVSEAHQMGFAAATEDAVLSQVQKLNQHRTHPLEYAIAAIASIKGLQDAKHQPVGHELQSGMMNVASVILHTRRNARSPGMVLGKQVNHSVPVELPCGQPGSLLVDWYITAQPLSKLKQRTDVRVINGF